MSAITETDTPADARKPLGPIIAAGAGAAVLVLAGLYLDTPWKKQGDHKWALTTESHGVTDLVICVGFVAIGLAVVYGVVTRGLRLTANRENRWALTLAAIGALSGIVYWTGLPIILAVGALVLANDARARLGRISLTTWIVLALALSTAYAVVDLALVG